MQPDWCWQLLSPPVDAVIPVGLDGDLTEPTTTRGRGRFACHHTSPGCRQEWQTRPPHVRPKQSSEKWTVLTASTKP